MKQFAKCFVGALALAALAVSVDGSLSAGEKAGAIKVGDKAPAFESINEDGKPWKSSDYFGKKVVVVYFYPADFTGGCTKQACGFRDDFKALTDKGVEIIGVSGDSAKTHAAFKKAHMLTFTLLADEDGAVATKLGVPFSKKQGTAKFGNETFTRAGTASRYTVVVGPDGNIAAHYAVKDAAGDSKKILEIVEKLKTK